MSEDHKIPKRVSDLISEGLEEPLPEGWGKWSLDRDRRLLVYEANGPREYSVGLLDIRSSAHLLDWIYQLEAKAWLRTEDLGYLVRALGDIFHPQQTMCSFEKNLTFNPDEYLAERLR